MPLSPYHTALASDLSRSMSQESVSSPEDVLFIEYNENTSELAMSRLYALPAYYGKDFEDEDLCLFGVLDQAMEDHGGELAPIQQTCRPLTRDDTPDRCCISGWFANKIAV